MLVTPPQSARLKSTVVTPLAHYSRVAVEPLRALLADREAKLKAAVTATGSHNALAKTAGTTPARLNPARADMLAAQGFAANTDTLFRKQLQVYESQRVQDTAVLLEEWVHS